MTDTREPTVVENPEPGRVYWSHIDGYPPAAGDDEHRYIGWDAAVGWTGDWDWNGLPPGPPADPEAQEDQEDRRFAWQLAPGPPDLPTEPPAEPPAEEEERFCINYEGGGIVDSESPREPGEELDGPEGACWMLNHLHREAKAATRRATEAEERAERLKQEAEIQAQEEGPSLNVDPLALRRERANALRRATAPVERACAAAAGPNTGVIYPEQLELQIEALWTDISSLRAERNALRARVSELEADRDDEREGQEWREMPQAYRSVKAERQRQKAKWGDQSGKGDAVFCAILGEEFGEVCQAVIDEDFDLDDLRAELVQVAAVAIQWIETIDVKQDESFPVSSPRRMMPGAPCEPPPSREEG